MRVLRCDVSDEASVVSMLLALRDVSAGGGIRGIIHAAGVIRDSLIRGGCTVLVCCACLRCCSCALCLCAVLVCCACVLCLCAVLACCACVLCLFALLCLCAVLVCCACALCGGIRGIIYRAQRGLARASVKRPAVPGIGMVLLPRWTWRASASAPA